ncbi:hypothetical protein CRENBAI_010430 [Crenichthys baileyi]|uniref:Uncharacterized protein n=1 Tax=Crenichthys baileyi TaxID=28760 RepID=A0AAV9QTG0_9TELE
MQHFHILRASGSYSSSKERKLCAFPFIEIYHSDVIDYMVPLSRQTDFFVPEMTEELKAGVKDEDSDEDRGTDITVGRQERGAKREGETFGKGRRVSPGLEPRTAHRGL